MTYNLRSRKRVGDNRPPSPEHKKTKNNSVTGDDSSYDSLDDFIDDSTESYDLNQPQRLLDILIGGNQEFDNFVDHWKDDLDSKEADKLSEELNHIRDEINKELPSIPRIINSTLSFKDKKRCIMLYDGWRQLSPMSEEYYEVAKQINNIIKSSVEGDLLYEERRIRKMVIPEKSMKERILTLPTSDKIKSVIYGRYEILTSLDPTSSNYSTNEEWLRWALMLPYNSYKQTIPPNSTKKDITTFLSNIREKLDQSVFGMDTVKEELLHQINNHFSSSNKTKGCIISLKGCSGVGKTHVSKVLADALRLPFHRVSLAGLEDTSLIKGSDSVWVGASPSIFVQALVNMKCNNGVLLLDEMDKLFQSSKALACQHALLHPLDYTTNHEFEDIMLKGLPIDLSGLFIVCAMNDDRNIDINLRDRLTPIIEIKPYSPRDKKIIIQKFLIPQTLKRLGMKTNSITFTPQAIDKLIYLSPEEKGVREVKTNIERIFSRVNMLRTCSGKDRDHLREKLKLSYSMEFSDFPLKITTKSLESLYHKQNKTSTLSYYT